RVRPGAGRRRADRLAHLHGTARARPRLPRAASGEERTMNRLSILAAAALLLAACAEKKQAARAPESVPVTVATVEKRDVPVTVAAIGHVEALSNVSVKS